MFNILWVVPLFRFVGDSFSLTNDGGTSLACFLRWKVIAGMGAMPLPLLGEPGNWGMEEGGK